MEWQKITVVKSFITLDPGQLYDVQSKIKIYTKHWLGLLTYYDILNVRIPCAVRLDVVATANNNGH